MLIVGAEQVQDVDVSDSRQFHLTRWGPAQSAGNTTGRVVTVRRKKEKEEEEDMVQFSSVVVKVENTTNGGQTYTPVAFSSGQMSDRWSSDLRGGGASYLRGGASVLRSGASGGVGDSVMGGDSLRSIASAPEIRVKVGTSVADGKRDVDHRRVRRRRRCRLSDVSEHEIIYDLVRQSIFISVSRSL